MYHWITVKLNHIQTPDFNWRPAASMHNSLEGFAHEAYPIKSKLSSFKGTFL